MAISANAVWEIRGSLATANNVNGGFFVTGASGTDYSQQNAAQYNLTAVTTSGASAILLTTSASADMVGNGCAIVSGTNFTSGFYQIISAVVGVSITLDRNGATGVGAAGVVNVGGALSLNSVASGRTDANWGTSLVAGNIVYFKGPNTTTLAGNVVATVGTAGNPIKFIGYNTTRGDNPTGANRPTLASGASMFFSLATRNQMYNIISTGQGATNVIFSTMCIVNNCKFINNGTTAAQPAVTNTAGANTMCVNSEFISYRGPALSLAGAIIMYGCYIHDSDIGISLGAGATCSIQNCIISDNVTDAISMTTSNGTSPYLIEGCTLYGAENKLGNGILTISGATNLVATNNIIYGFVTGINDANVAGNNYENYNDFNNNTTDRVNISVGVSSVTTAPAFVGVAQITGTTATTNASILTQAGGNFASVTDGVDFCYIKSGTGVTAGKYLITAHTTTTITLDSAPGNNASTNTVYQVTTGHNFATGSGLNGTANPTTFSGTSSTSSSKVGAVQSVGGASVATVSAVF